MSQEPHQPHKNCPSWPFYCRLRLGDQDVIADINQLRLELDLLSENPSVKEKVTICRQALDCCELDHRRLFKSRIVVRQGVFAITGQVLLVTPVHDLEGAWIGIKQRFEKIDKSEARFFADTIRRIDEFFEKIKKKSGDDNGEHGSCDTDDKAEQEIRSLIKAVRLFFDKKIIAELWAGLDMVRHITSFCILALIIAGAAVFAIYNENGSTLMGIDIDTKHTVITTVLFGMLGAIISTLTKPRRTGDGGSIPLVRISPLRPILGGLAGLFLYMVATSGVVSLRSLPYLSLYAAAMAFGFSERALIRVLSAAAGRIESGAGRAIGLGRSRNQEDNPSDGSLA